MPLTAITAWVEKMGADHVVNHRNLLNEEHKTLRIQPRYVENLMGAHEHQDSGSAIGKTVLDGCN